VFRCKECHCTFNERIIEVPTDSVFQVLLGRFRYKLSLHNIVEFFLLGGFESTQETVRDWEERLAPMFTEQLRCFFSSLRKNRFAALGFRRRWSSTSSTFLAEPTARHQ
jgi:hypothetical protein